MIFVTGSVYRFKIFRHQTKDIKVGYWEFHNYLKNPFDEGRKYPGIVNKY